MPATNENWHSLGEEETLRVFGAHPEKGLCEEDAERRLKEEGLNLLTAKKGAGWIKRFLLQLHQPLIYILIVAGFITAILGEWVDSGVIFGVVLLNAIIGFLQEAKALNALAALANTMGSTSVVVRDGQKRELPASQLVRGDLVLLQGGDKVPADLRLLQAKELRVDESALTGESLPVDKRPGSLDAATGLADRVNMAFASSLVTTGTAKGIVTVTGDRTEVGRISTLLSDTDVLATPLTRKFLKFSHLMLWVILGMAGLTFAVGMARGQSAMEMFMASVALAVGAIPEGLPAAVTITLAIGVSRMARRRAIIRKLPAVETLGSTTVICTDKTGTLTENQMTVQEILCGGETYTVTGVGYDPEGTISRGASPVLGNPAALEECLLAGTLCNDGRHFKTEGVWKIQGDPTDASLLVAARKGGMDVDAVQAAHPRRDYIAFESERQYMATLNVSLKDVADIPVVYVKGGAETVLGRCSDALDAQGGTIALDRSAVLKVLEDMASRGMRVLAFARKIRTQGTETLGHQDIETGLTFLGLQAMIDPPRPEAMEAVRACQAAGIRIIMITGDHATTAAAIAGKIGIFAPGHEGEIPVAVTGKVLEGLSDGELEACLEKASVFARVVPEQKLRLVKALQAKGHVVAMTGDGVNDAPALKRADIGVAMGITGTEVAKEAAAMVLTDDNFSSIEAAVEEGRGVYDNLVKFITWTLPTNFGEGLVILAAVFAGTTLPILPVQILWINMTTAVLLGLMLVFEAKEPDIMGRFPRDPAQPILTKALLWRIGFVGVMLLAAAFGIFERLIHLGASIETARTAAVNVFVIVELFYLFNCRSLTQSMFKVGFFSNPSVFLGAGLMLVLQALFTHHPVMNRLFHSAPLDGKTWGLIFLAGIAVYLVVEAEKWFRARRAGR